MKLLSKLLSIALLSTLAGFSLVASAEEYLVEVVFFGQPSAPLVQGSNPELDWEVDAVDLENTARTDVRAIDQTRYRLSDQARKLE